MSKMLESCDTFVVLPPLTKNGCVIFGKNSDRPASEVQEIVYVPPQKSAGAKTKCTFIEIDQVAQPTLGVVLSKPAWMWGAEMGANEKGVVIGNEAVWTKVGSEREEKLLGMDLLRLALERGTTAAECLDVITSLLEKYGQGGQCSEFDPSLIYHNSFLIADPKEAWVLETVGKEWVTEKIESGFRNMSNILSIRTKIDKISPNIKSFAKRKGWWDGSEPFDFAKTYSPHDTSVCSRFENGRKLLENFTQNENFDLIDMMNILRDKPSGICMTNNSGGTKTTSSQVSMLSASNKNIPAVHFFTGTPNPTISVFKPFVFGPKLDATLSPHITSPVFNDSEDPAKLKPRFASHVDRRHNLYKFHEMTFQGRHPRKTADQITVDLQVMEQACLQDIQTAFSDDKSIADSETLFKDAVDAELKIYKY